MSKDTKSNLPVYRPNGRGIGVVFENITVKSEGNKQRTVFDLLELLKTVIYTPVSMIFHVLGRQSNATSTVIIDDITGVIFPGETMLVLGRPGSGCTTTLKVIANDRESFKEVGGKLQYATIPAAQMTGSLKSEVVYNSEDDIHFPTLSVHDTLDFALRLRKPATENTTSDREFSEDLIERLLSSLDMLHVKGTIVGDSFIRGVSGGERKRVSLAEALTVNSAVSCWDNPIRGLDSSSAFKYLRLLKAISQETGMANIVTIYQASESMFHECFDRTLLLYDGRMIFCGRIEEAKQYFIDLGFYCPDRQTTPDFITAVTSPTERQIREDYDGPLYLNKDSLAAKFRESRHFKQLQDDITSYYQTIGGDSTREIALRDDLQNVRSKYTPTNFQATNSIWKQVMVSTRRYYQLFWGDRNTFFTILALCVVNSVITGSAYYDAPKTATGSFERGGALFFSIVYFFLNAMTELVKTVNSRSILLKQHKMGMIHPIAYVVTQTLADMPLALIQSLLFACCYYFLVGLTQTASQFFIFVLIVFVHYSAVSSLFRMLGAWSPTLNFALLLAGSAMPVASLYSGYAPPVPTMHPWGSWIRRIAPTPYALEALMGNEFYAITLHCTESQLVPSGPSYGDIRYQGCPMAGSKIGSADVAGSVYLEDIYAFSRAHLWRNFGINLVMWFLYTLLAAIGLTILTKDNGSSSGPVFKRGAKIALGRIVETPYSDPEKQPVSQPQPAFDDSTSSTVNNSLASPSDKELSESKENPVNFTFCGVNYFVPVASQQKQLLDDVYGYVKPGQLTALMGASGAGKTTLLDILSQRKYQGTVEGRILLNGSELEPSFARSCGFCMQQDVHECSTTVREALQFSAHLRQSAQTPESEKLAYVEHVISLLELGTIADALVGEAGDGHLNVEERKRVTIGVELAAKPSALLFLDEPTSGLDSQAAFSIVFFLRKIAAEGIPIVCTIHQPSGMLFEMFDHVLLLASGGKTVYFGETGENAQHVRDYFAKNGAIMGKTDNPAEFIISTVAVKPENGGHDWVQTWNDSLERQVILDRISRLNEESASWIRQTSVDKDQQFALSLWHQTIAVTKRHWTAVWRNGLYNFSKLFKSIFFELFISFTFFKLGCDIQGLENHMLGILLIVWIIPAVAADIQAVWFEKWAIFEARERNGIYDWKALLIALTVVEIPWNLVNYTVIFLCSYWTMGFTNTPAIAGFVYFMYLLLSVFATGFCHLMAALFPNATMAGYANSLSWVVLMMFSGIPVPHSALNDFYRPWLFWADPMRYFFGATVSSVLHDVKAHCAESDLATYDPPTGQTCYEYTASYMNQNPGYLIKPNATTLCGYCSYSVGDDYSSTLDFFYSERWRDLAVFLGFCLTTITLVFFVTWITRVKMRQWRR
ncbi:P-loop containing nucleoside triphosphate hydrolase protein [Penicillium nucicola]|uniref:P-loop containing nucleoside triphosphate hydrolase protein n=1 Tax=Penicillium nucicola TaxID=1850975 RepID=UPI0025452546|nr:P-loop containing nucleoside triphosphate hydrolase protein [Penicillium nucicola]KAJ5757976.1 P-loop containing nucleoside triphosphate hydrolase protein [Penicillium nucicola]